MCTACTTSWVQNTPIPLQVHLWMARLLRLGCLLISPCPTVVAECLLPSALAWGSESRIYSHKVRMYVHTCVCTWWVTLRNVTRNVVTYHRHRYRPYVRHTVWHIQIRSTQIDRRRRHSLAMEVRDDGAVGPSQFGYYKHQTASPTAPYLHAHPHLIWCTHIVCALARGKDAHAYS